MRKIVDVMPGMKFNRLTAIKDVGKDKNGHSIWLFKCDCGNEKIIERYLVVSGKTRSCGCYLHDVLKSGDNRRQHGMCGTRIHHIWKGIHGRCNHPTGKNSCYKNISYCSEWEQFEPFYEWAINNGYDDSLTIDRIDSNGNYEPSNCRWVTWEVQANNTSQTRHVTYKGETHTIREWSNIIGLNYNLLNQRYCNGERGDILFRPYKMFKKKMPEGVIK